VGETVPAIPIIKLELDSTGFRLRQGLMVVNGHNKLSIAAEHR
jgi:hypothetical protein